MKKIAILFILMTTVLAVCLTGCDLLDTFVPEIDTDLDSDLPSGDGDSDGDGDENDGGETDGGNGTDNSGAGAHVCDYKYASYMESSCTVAGKDVYKCTCGKSYEEPRALAPHTEETIPAKEATGGSPALSEGKKCSVCGCVLVAPVVTFEDDFETPSKYDGDYAYNYISTLAKGEKLTKLYNSIDDCADLFHINGEDAGEDLVVAVVNFGDLGLTSDEAIAVWSAYTIDHPLYYWISKQISYTSESLSIKVDEEYKSGAVRNSYNAKIYATAEEFIGEIQSNSTYSMALTLHDLIIGAGDYAYESDGVTPKDDAYAHNILGILEIGEGVCESYAKSFQMMLNYCGIENIFVSGYAGEAHAWNMIKLEDNNWYWCDLTWDDKPDFAWGVSHRYFCVNGTESLMGMDGPWIVAAETFDSTHFPAAKCDTGISFAYTLPEDSSTSFDESDFLLRKTFKSGNFTYALVGYDSVQLVKIEQQGEVVIPATVEYGGYVFDVVSIGCIDENGLLKTGSLVAEYYDNYGNLSMQITSISIPETVMLIWDDALNIHTLAEITVDEDNEVYASLDGVLFTKDYLTLVKYPSARSAEVYILPDVTKNIAAYAFNMYYGNVELTNLTTIRLGSNIEMAGITHYGYGYAGTEHGNVRSGEWERIENYLKGDGVIYAKSGAEFVPAA